MATGESAPLLEGEASAPEPGHDADGNPLPLTKEDDLSDADSMKRGCTDLPCTLLFFFAIGYMFMLHSHAFHKGDPRRLFYGKDYDGNVCGVDNGVKDYPYLYYPYKDQASTSPSLLGVPGQGLVISLQLQNLLPVCTKACPPGGVETPRDTSLCPAKDAEHCTWYGMDNSVYNVRDRYCIFQDPKSFVDHGALCHNVKKEAVGAITELNEKNVHRMEDLTKVVVAADGSLQTVMDEAIDHLRQEGEIAKAEVLVAVDQTSESCKEANTEPEWVSMMADLVAIKEILFCVPLVTLFLGFAYFIFLRYCAGCFIWGIIFTIVGGAALGSFVLFDKHTIYMMEGLQDDARYCWWGSLLLGILAAGVGILAACSCTTLRMTVAMVKTVSAFLMQTPSVLMTVPMMLFFSAVWLLYMVLSGLYLVSTLKIDPVSSAMEELTRYHIGKQLIYKCMYHLLMGLWVNAILTGLLIIGLAASVRHWYYAKPDESGTKQTPFMVGFVSVGTAVRYHFGTAVFGGLILAIIQMLRIVLKVVEKQVKKYQSNSTVQFLIKIVDWFLWCMQKVVEMINQTSYIICGLKGSSFYTSAKRAVGLILGNPKRFFILHGVGVLLEYLGIVLTLGGSVFFFYNVLVHSGMDKKLRSLLAPLLCIALIAGLTAKVFFSLFTASADAFFFCFVFDEEVAKVTGKSDAQHCPETLKAFLEDEHAKDDEKGGRGCCGC